ncbi:MAG: hypothetical protein N2042_00830 [Thermodesulfovibrio sp.]|nr:hypothetical protein [Thermodesulfovibrio sp.]
MQNLFIESDLKEANHEAHLLVTQADETVLEAFKALLLATKTFNKKVQDAIQGYEEAKAIIQEIKDFTTDEYTQCICEELIEELTKKAVKYEHICSLLNHFLRFMQ